MTASPDSSVSAECVSSQLFASKLALEAEIVSVFFPPNGRKLLNAALILFGVKTLHQGYMIILHVHKIDTGALILILKKSYFLLGYFKPSVYCFI